MNAKTILSDYQRIYNNLNYLHRELFPIKAEALYPVDQYKYPEKILAWFDGDQSRTLILEGPSGIGKTQGILALIHSLNKTPLVIKERNDLKELTSKIDVLVLDDLHPTNFKADELKHLLD